MGVKSLSSCIDYTVKPSKDIPPSEAPKTEKIRQSIIDKIPIFLHEFDEQRFKQGMYLLPWHDQGKFSVRGCGKLCVTKELKFEHAVGFQDRPRYDSELTAETELRDGGKHVLWVKEADFNSYEYVALILA